MIQVFTGANRTKIKQEVETLKKRFTNTYGEAGLQVATAELLDTEQLSSYLAGASLFTSHKLVIIKDISSSKELSAQFLTLSTQVPDETDILLIEEAIDKRTTFFKELKKRFHVVEYGELSEDALQNWVQHYVEQEKGTISSDNARLLVRNVGANQEQLQHEINKLVAYRTDITQEAIELLVEKKSEETVFQLLEASLSGRRDRTLAVLDGLERAHEDPFAIANMLIWQAHIVGVVAAAGTRSDSEIAKQAQLNPYVVQKTKRLVSQLSPHAIQTIIDRIAQLDIKLKSIGGNPWRLLEQTILDMGR